MHCRVLESQCSPPIPNLKSAPSKAISSVHIWPLLRNAIDSGPCWSSSALNLSVNTWSPWSQSTGSKRCVFLFRSRGVVARSGAASGASASQPLGHARPRFTGYSGSGVRLTARPFCRCAWRPQPTEQKPHTSDVTASGAKRAGTLPSPKSPGRNVSSAVSGPSHRRSGESRCSTLFFIPAFIVGISTFRLWLTNDLRVQSIVEEFCKITHYFMQLSEYFLYLIVTFDHRLP